MSALLLALLEREGQAWVPMYNLQYRHGLVVPEVRHGGIVAGPRGPGWFQGH